MDEIKKQKFHTCNSILTEINENGEIGKTVVEMNNRPLCESKFIFFIRQAVKIVKTVNNYYLEREMLDEKTFKLTNTAKNQKSI